MSNTKLIRDTFEKGEGVLRMIPVFVPRRFSKPGRRLRLDFQLNVSIRMKSTLKSG